MTAAVQADLELEGFPGRVATEDKGLQFGSSFQRHSEPSTPTQGGAVRTVRTQGLFSYREDYRPAADAASLPAPEPWLGPPLDTPDSGRAPPCRRDGPWFLELLRAETARMERWCKDMEREAEEQDLAEDGEAPPRGAGPSRRHPRRPQAPRTAARHLAAAGSGVRPAPQTRRGPAALGARFGSVPRRRRRGGHGSPGQLGGRVSLNPSRLRAVTCVQRDRYPPLIPAASAHPWTPSSAFAAASCDRPHPRATRDSRG